MFFWDLFSLFILLFLVNLKLSAANSVKNNYFKLCSRSSRDFGKCIQESIMEARPKFIKGIPEIGLPTLDPLSFPNLNFNENNRHLKVNAKFTEMYYTGFSNMTVKDVEVSGNINSEMTINLTVTSPVFRCVGVWSGRGRAFQFTVDGGGKFDANLTQTDLKLMVKGRAEINEKDGKKYFSVKSTILNPVIRKAHVFLTGLFPNDERLTKVANKFINRNMMFVLRLVRKYPQKYIGGVLEQLVKIVFDAWPIDELMLE